MGPWKLVNKVPHCIKYMKACRTRLEAFQHFIGFHPKCATFALIRERNKNSPLESTNCNNPSTHLQYLHPRGMNGNKEFAWTESDTRQSPSCNRQYQPAQQQPKNRTNVTGANSSPPSPSTSYPTSISIMPSHSSIPTHCTTYHPTNFNKHPNQTNNNIS